MSKATTSSASSNFETETITYLFLKLNDLYNAVTTANLDAIKEAIDILNESKLSDKLIRRCYTENKNCITQLDLIFGLFIGRGTNNDKSNALRYLLYETDILHHLKNPNIDEKLEDEQRTTVFCHAICLNDNLKNYKLITEELYDFWCDRVHWSGYSNKNDVNIINNIKRTGCSLDNARKKCALFLAINQQMEVNIHCLIIFNDFQCRLYTELHELFKGDINNESNIDNINNNKVIKMRNMGLIVTQIYADYSHIKKVRIPSRCDESEKKIKKVLSDQSTKYFIAFFNQMYELYFRKLDFTVSLLILDNLTIFKNFVIDENMNELYQKIECSIYYFIYRANENWRVYLPKNKKKHNVAVLGIYENKYIQTKLKFDEHRVFNALVLLLEREDFVKCLKQLGQSISKLDLTTTQPQNVNMNSLKYLPYMRDAYSLKKIIDAMVLLTHNDIVDEMGVLIIEQVIQITGEMLKTSNASLHLSSTTRALVDAECSVETIKCLSELRDYLSHMDYNGQITISTRIDAITQNIDKYKKVQDDLIYIYGGLQNVQNINKSMTDKYLVVKGLNLLRKRIQELPTELKPYIEHIIENYTEQDLINLDRVPDICIGNNRATKLFKKQLLKEVLLNVLNQKTMKKTKKEINKTLNNEINKLLYKHFTSWKNTLNNIKKILAIWQDITKTIKDTGLLPKLLKKMPSMPNVDFLFNLNRKIAKLPKHVQGSESANLFNNIKQIENLLKKCTHEWNVIIEVLLFCVNEVKEFNVFKTDIDKIYKDTYKKNNNNINIINLPEEGAVNIIDEFIKHMESNDVENKDVDKNHVFNKIETIHLRELLTLFNKGIKVTKYPMHKRNKILLCLQNRIDLLKTHLRDVITTSPRQQVIKYNVDFIFRCVVNMLLADIFNIFKHCGLNKLIIKSTNILGGSNLRNLLCHGNPLIEVIGQVLDDQDYSTEIMNKANIIIKDSKIIDALYMLFKIYDPNKKTNILNASEDEFINDFCQLAKICDKNKIDYYLSLFKIQFKSEPASGPQPN